MVAGLQKYRLVEVYSFDVKQGYKKCTPPGVSVANENGLPLAVAEFWRDQSGKLFVRCTSKGHVYHFEARSTCSNRLHDHELGEFQGYIEEVLNNWVGKGQ